MQIHYPTIYKRVKHTLFNITNIPVEEIYAHMELAADPLGFTPQGLRALAPRLNSVFYDYNLDLKRSDTGSLKTVRSIARLVYTRIAED